MDPKQSERSSGTLRGSEGLNLTLRTPQKTNEPILTEPKLSERYRIIMEFFDPMTCSLRLLNLCKKSPTFQNVSSQVEILTKRKFQYKHLAQIKYILPEAVLIDKILIHDKETLCMRPDVKITLLFDGIDVHPEHSRVMASRERFASRLEDFVSTHPQACDVPEAVLPELFNKKFQSSSSSEAVAWGSAVRPQHTSEVGNLLEVPSALQHFRKHSSEKVLVSDLGKTSLLISQRPHLPLVSEEVFESRHVNCMHSLCAESDAVNGQTINSRQDEVTPEGFPGFASSSNFGHLTSTGLSAGSISCESPTVKVSSKAENLFIETPAQLTPKRLILNDKNCKISMDSKKCMSCQNPTKRSLNFSVEGDDSTSSFVAGESKSSGLVPFVSTCVAVPVAGANISKSRTVAEKEDHSFSQTSSGMCQQMSSMPGTVAVIDDIFRAMGCSSITKEELVHKIMINNFDIVERREVEEQVELLENLVPDWIHRKSTPSGDIMYSVKRVSNIEHILSMLSST